MAAIILSAVCGSCLFVAAPAVARLRMSLSKNRAAALFTPTAATRFAAFERAFWAHVDRHT